MTPNFEAAVPAQRLLLETVHAITLKNLEGAEKLIALNIQAARSVLEDIAHHADSLNTVKDPQSMLQKVSSMAQPAGEKMTAYARQVYEIQSETSGAIAQTLQNHLRSSQEAAQSWFDAASRTAPAGSEPMFAAARSALSVVRATFDRAAQASHSAAETTEETLSTTAKPSTRGRRAA